MWLMKTINRKDKLYYARILPKVGVFDVCELTVRTVTDSWFVGIEKRDKRAYLFDFSALDNIVFVNRKDALKKVSDAEVKNPKVSSEIDYEEY